MEWMLVFIVVSTSATDKVISPINVPMATEKLCKEGNAKLTEAYRQSKAANFMIVSECLKVR